MKGYGVEVQGIMTALHRHKLNQELIKYGIEQMEPLVNFALCCGAQSSPMVIPSFGNHVCVSFIIVSSFSCSISLNVFMPFREHWCFAPIIGTCIHCGACAWGAWIRASWLCKGGCRDFCKGKASCPKASLLLCSWDCRWPCAVGLGVRLSSLFTSCSNFQVYSTAALPTFAIQQQFCSSSIWLQFSLSIPFKHLQKVGFVSLSVKKHWEKENQIEY